MPRVIGKKAREQQDHQQYTLGSVNNQMIDPLHSSPVYRRKNTALISIYIKAAR
jgi:hypothetical protein